MARTPNDHVIAHEQHPVRAGQEAGGRLGAGTIYACLISGISLTDYSLDPSQKGWGPHCTGPFTTITASNGVQVTVDSRIAELVTLLFNETLRRGYAIRQADTGAYNCRYIAGTTIWSNHAWGLAIDINWTTNPQKSPVTTDQPAWMLQLWNQYGFAWGGNYNSPTVPDAMHHEFMGTPAQAVTATNLARTNFGGGTTTTYTVQGAIAAHYNDPALGLAQLLGPPITNETTCPDGVGKFNHFQNHGSIYWTPSTGAWAVYGAIRDLWQNMGWETSSLGYPLNDEHADNGGRRNDFQHGYIWWSAATGALLNSGGSGSPPPPTTTLVKETSPITGNSEIPGFDCSSSKPSASAMKAAGYEFVVGYVSPTSGKNLSAAQVQAYRAAGIAVGLVWESTAGRALTGGSAGGTADGQAAEAQANAVGYPTNCVIFFAVDQDTTSADYAAIQAYANAFNAATQRPVGIYGEADIVDHFVTPGVAPVRYGWQTAAWSAGRVSTKANLYQRVGHPAWPVPAGVATTDFDEDVLLLAVPLMGA